MDPQSREKLIREAMKNPDMNDDRVCIANISEVAHPNDDKTLAKQLKMI